MEIEELKAQLKKEIKEELLAELRNEKVNVSSSKGSDFDYHEYKNQVVADDVAKVEAFIKVRKKRWYIPIAGFAIYMYEYGQMLTSLDRGIVSQNINKASLKWLWIDIPFYYMTWLVGFINYLPITHRKILKKAIELTKNSEER